MIRTFFFCFALVFMSNLNAQTPCVDGFAGEYPCDGLDLLSVRTLEELGGGANGNDCWGWVDPESGREFVLYGRANGLSVVEVTDPINPVFAARVPTATVQSLWRDVKVFDNHAFVVSEAEGHGMQVVDLSQVLDVEDAPEALTPVSTYLGFGNAHNLAMNESSGFAYGVGTNTAGGGLHAVDVSDPTSPVVAGTYDGAYTHDAQVVNYAGPDADYAGHEIAICFNGSAGVAIVDVTDKADMELISSFNYTESAYTHQGWLNDSHDMVYFNDELDEQGFGNGTRTYIADLSDLDNPVVLGFYQSDNTSSDHNLYIRGDKLYASNYMSGLRVFTFSPDGNLEPYAHFDVRPDSDTTSFYGTWSNYPYFPSGNIAISCRTVGLFMVADPEFVPTNVSENAPSSAVLLQVFPNPARGTVMISGMPSAQRMRVLNVVGQEVRPWRRVPGLQRLNVDVSDLPEGVYLVQAEAAHGAARTARLVVKR